MAKIFLLVSVCLCWVSIAKSADHSFMQYLRIEQDFDSNDIPLDGQKYVFEYGGRRFVIDNPNREELAFFLEMAYRYSLPKTALTLGENSTKIDI